MANRKLRIGRGRSMVDMDSTMHDLVARTLRNAQPRVMNRLEKEAEELYTEAHGAWPVKTGRSRDALDHGLRLPNVNQIESFVGIDANSEAVKYAYMIKGKEQGGKSTWQTLVRRPGIKRARKLAEDLAKDLVAAADPKRGG